MGEVGSVSCVGFLVEGTGAFVLVGGAGSYLSGGQGHSRRCVLGCLWPIMILGSLSANGWGCVPVLFGMGHPALELAGR